MKTLTTTMFALLVLVSPSSAHIWHVEKDGSGDFTVIQDAVEVAASGDTLQIGPGRYEDPFDGTYYNNVRIEITQKSLTFLGAGIDTVDAMRSTIIGPVEPLSNSDHPIGLIVKYNNDNDVVIKDIRFENLILALRTEYSRKLVLDGCALKDNYFTLDLSGQNTVIKNCRFEDVWLGGMSIINQNQNLTTISDCSFNLSDRNFARHVAHYGPGRMDIERCTFYGGITAIQAGLSGDEINISNSTISHVGDATYHIGYAIFVDGIACNVSNCIISDIEGFGIGHDSSHPVMLNVEGVEFSNVGRGSFAFGRNSLGHIRDCILAKGEQYVVAELYYWARSGMLPDNLNSTILKKIPSQINPRMDIITTDTHGSHDASMPDTRDIHFDMTDNWWGTTDPDSIQAWIHDSNDGPLYGYFPEPFYIEWQPYKSEPVEMEKTSFGSLKAMFKN